MKKRLLLRGLAAVCIFGATFLIPGPAAVADDAPQRQQRDSIFINKDSGFNPANGVRSGSGTASDPYVISGWDVDWIELKDTSAHVLITGNTIRNSLVLDWAGPGIHVHNNDIGDLRVNQNVKRKGAATSGAIMHNKIGVVGQLRHFDGVFSHNVVGFQDGEQPWELLFKQRAVNFDGFNGARFVDNVIYGYMDARLHGHHHGSSFEETSHYHGAAYEGHADMVDHSRRYHTVTIARNKIYSDSEYALAYLDTAHSANDRTAASETNKALNQPHVHFTRVKMLDNQLIGSGLWVDVFNAKDERHTGTRTGSLTIADNVIKLEKSQFAVLEPWYRMFGIYVWQARDVNVSIAGNKITAPVEEDTLGNVDDSWFYSESAGIMLDRIDKGSIQIGSNAVTNTVYGVRAAQMDGDTHWMIGGLKTQGVEHPVYWDDSVKNPPKRRS